jgi:N-acetylglucosamine-6-phosphate deacetylase
VLIAGERVAGMDGPGYVEVDGTAIAAVGAGAPPAAAEVTGAWVVPGFVDLHVHGGGGASFQDGEAAQVAEFHRRHGTTTLLASLMTAPLDALERSIAALRDSRAVAGIHLEGPFLAAARCGAHDPALMRAPAAADVERLLAAGDGAVRMVTLAPELDGGLDAVAQVVAGGAAAAVGHTDASYELTRAAIAVGATVATHLFNGMAPPHHRRPGPAPALLEDERVVVELINDGVHLHPAVVRGVFAAAPGRVALITDAMAGAGMEDGEYLLGDRRVVVAGGVARLAGGDALAGSTLTQDAALRNAVLAGVAVEDAVAALSETPARVLGLGDRIGALAAGLAADLVVLDDDLQVVAVMAGGTWVQRGRNTSHADVRSGDGGARSGARVGGAGGG